jgi:cellulose biosynthesis protein BcsQ
MAELILKVKNLNLDFKKPMKIVVSGGKGGVGKSMVATSLAVEFAKKTKTMLVDADKEIFR